MQSGVEKCDSTEKQIPKPNKCKGIWAQTRCEHRNGLRKPGHGRRVGVGKGRSRKYGAVERGCYRGSCFGQRFREIWTTRFTSVSSTHLRMPLDFRDYSGAAWQNPSRSHHVTLVCRLVTALRKLWSCVGTGV
jgi:hypothetical protein